VARQADRASIRQVFVPTDADQNPTDDQVWVPQDLYEELLRRNAAQQREPTEWLLGSAKYKAQLTRDPMSGSLTVDQFKASFELDVFSPNTQVKIPFKAEDLIPAFSRAFLDGREIAIEFDPSNGLLSFGVPDARRYQLELVAQPSVTIGEDGSSGFDLAIPVLPNSYAELIFPPDDWEVVVESAVGSTEAAADGTRHAIHLGATDRLAVRWRNRATVSPAEVGEVGMEAEELFLWKIQPGVILKARLKLRAIDGQTERVQLLVDPRLRHQPSDDEGVTIGPAGFGTGGRQILELELGEPLVDERAIDLTFLLTNTSGIGNLTPPFFDLPNVQVTKRWIAVCVDPTLKAPTTPDNWEEIDLGRFRQSWGEMDEQPLFAASLSSATPTWSLFVEPRELKVTARQTLTLNFDLGEADVHFDAEMTTQSGYAFQYQIDVPQALRVESISVLENDLEKVDHWSYGADGAIHAFFKGPISGNHRLILDGRLRVPLRKEIALPAIRVRQSELETSLIGIFRQPSVEVLIHDMETEPETDPRLPGAAAPGRLVRWLESGGLGETTARMTVAPNRPRIQADQTTILRHDGNSWLAEAEFLVRTKTGVVDELTVEPSSDWHGPYTMDADASLEVVEESEADQRRLLIRPTAALTADSGEYRLKVSGPVSVPTADRVAVPHIGLRDAEIRHHWVLLPSRLGEQQLIWDARGLEKSTPPGDQFGPLQVDGDFVVYRALSQSFHARLDRTTDASEVYLADYRLVWTDDGTCWGLAAFDALFVSGSYARIGVPDRLRLVHVRVNGRPSLPRGISKGVYEVPIGPKGIPQHLEVVFVGEVLPPSPNTPWQFSAPSINSLPVRSTLWKISAPTGFRCTDVAGAQSCDRLELDLVRLRQLTALADSATDQTPGGPEEAWCRAWAQLSEEARLTAGQRVDQERDAERREAALARLAEMKKAHGELPEELGPGSETAQWSAAAFRPYDSDRLWPGTREHFGPPELAVSKNGNGSIRLTYERVDAGGLSHRLIAAACTAAMTVAIGLAITLGIVSRIFRGWPAVFGVVFGLVWWLWLSPSFVGWIVIVIVLLVSFLPGWRRARTGDSAIITVSYGQR
jgi:hypothetical protein